MPPTDIRHLDIGMLRTFDALLAERSVSRAAERLFLSQSAVSSTLRRLRDAFGDPLFTRMAHGVEPTARAHALAPHVRAALSEIGKLLTAGRDFDPAQSDRIFRIHGSDNMGARVLPQLCKELAAMQSGIRILWEPADHRTCDALLRGDADMGLLPRFTPPEGLLTEVLHEGRHVLVARPGLLSGPVTLNQFCAAPQVVLGYGRSTIEDLVDQVVARARLRRYPQVALTSFAQIAALLEQSDHIAIFPEGVARAYAARLAAHALPFELPRYQLHLCSSLRSEADPAIQWLRSRCRQVLRCPGDADPLELPGRS